MQTAFLKKNYIGNIGIHEKISASISESFSEKIQRKTLGIASIEKIFGGTSGKLPGEILKKTPGEIPRKHLKKYMHEPF